MAWIVARPGRRRERQIRCGAAGKAGLVFASGKGDKQACLSRLGGLEHCSFGALFVPDLRENRMFPAVSEMERAFLGEMTPETG